jgi:hypothetical protein
VASDDFSRLPLDSVLYMFYGMCMDWALAIDRHRAPLLRIVAALFALIGLGQGETVERLSRPLYRAVLRVLRPAEAAVRRLIIVAARDMVVKPSRVRPAPAGLKISSKAKGRVSFQLFDPRQRCDGDDHRYGGPIAEPRIHFIDVDPRSPLFRLPAPVAPAPEQDSTVRAERLCRRLAAIKGALEDLPRQARRYARWRAKPVDKRRPKLVSPLRPGTPPGLPNKPSHEVHAILRDCHWLACTVPQPDTS